MKHKLLKMKLKNNDLKLGMTVSHHWGKVRMMVKVKVVEQGRTTWKPEALKKPLLLS